jgi:hypothetical protein
MQESFPIVTAPAKANIPSEEIYGFSISHSSEIICNCLNNNSVSYPDGSWRINQNLLKIWFAINEYGNLAIFDRPEIPIETVNINWSQIPAGKLEQFQKTSNSICTAPNQTGMLNNPPKKFSDEYCVSLADWDASLFKTISVERTEEPKYMAELAAFLATDKAGFIN